ncbi:hypothetical protein BJ165DRAFT_384713 [Panaeolus papilionaceus]|nr:hypothetical protein BJ165DRAFT_384713 [Panaeolus papilionaceus]
MEGVPVHCPVLLARRYHKLFLKKLYSSLRLHLRTISALLQLITLHYYFHALRLNEKLYLRLSRKLPLSASIACKLVHVFRLSHATLCRFEGVEKPRRQLMLSYLSYPHLFSRSSSHPPRLFNIACVPIVVLSLRFNLSPAPPRPPAMSGYYSIPF